MNKVDNKVLEDINTSKYLHICKHVSQHSMRCNYNPIVGLRNYLSEVEDFLFNQAC